MKLPEFKYSCVNNQSQADTCDVFIDGDIVDADTQQWLSYWGIDTSTSFKSLRDQILTSGCNNINIYINSGGGMVADALAMHDFIVDQIAAGKNINTYGTGIVASAATYPLMAAGKNSHISKNAFFMIHNVSGGAYGSVDEMESAVRMMRKFNDCVRDLYAETTGQSASAITKMMNAETWMTGKEACENGFITECTATASTITNSIPKEKWLYTNTAILNTINNSITAPKEKGMKKNKIANAITAAFKSLGLVNDASLSTVKVTDLQQAITTSLSAEEDDDVTAEVTNAMKGEVFNAAVEAGITAFLAKENNAINAAIATATTNLITKETLETVKNDLANKLGTQTVRRTNGSVEEPENVADQDGWNR